MVHNQNGQDEKKLFGWRWSHLYHCRESGLQCTSESLFRPLLFKRAYHPSYVYGQKKWIPMFPQKTHKTMSVVAFYARFPLLWTVGWINTCGWIKTAWLTLTNKIVMQEARCKSMNNDCIYIMFKTRPTYLWCYNSGQWLPLVRGSDGRNMQSEFWSCCCCVPWSGCGLPGRGLSLWGFSPSCILKDSCPVVSIILSFNGKFTKKRCISISAPLSSSIAPWTVVFPPVK